MERHQQTGVAWYESSLLQCDGMRHGFGLKDHSVEAYAKVTCGASVQIPFTRQVHGATVHVIDQVVEEQLDGDGFCTANAGIMLHVRTADCLPILWCDPQQRVIGAIHAGWRGLAARVISATIATAAARFHCRPSDLRVAIGPAMGPNCYEVSGEVTEALQAAGHHLQRITPSTRAGHWLLDLAACAVNELEWNGITPAQIDCAALCTHCLPNEFHSYRRTPEISGRQEAFIVLGA